MGSPVREVLGAPLDSITFPATAESKSPYILPEHLKAAPLGIDWDSIPSITATPQAEFAALMDVCWGASDAIDTYCFQPLRSVAEIEDVAGPDFRLTAEQSGNYLYETKHWPVTQVLGAQVSPAANFPRQWTQIPAEKMDNINSSMSILTDNAGSSGSEGMNLIQVAPGFFGWSLGRGGYVAQFAYINGWPHTGLAPSTILAATYTKGSATVAVSSSSGLAVGQGVSGPGVPNGTIIADISGDTLTLSMASIFTGSDYLYVGTPAGVTELYVDDVTGFDGTRSMIYDLGGTEAIVVTGASAYTPISIFGGNVSVDAGPGTLTLAQPTRYPHAPQTTLITSIPANVRWAAYYFAAAEALTRGATAITAQALPGTMMNSGAGAIKELVAQAKANLTPFRRVF